MANSVLLHLGEDVVGNVKVGVNVEDIVTIVESVAEPEHLCGGCGVLEGDGRFGNVSEFLGVGLYGRLSQGFRNSIELISWVVMM